MNDAEPPVGYYARRPTFDDVAQLIVPSNAPPWLPAFLEWWAQGIRHDMLVDQYRPTTSQTVDRLSEVVEATRVLERNLSDAAIRNLLEFAGMPNKIKLPIATLKDLKDRAEATLSSSILTGKDGKTKRGHGKPSIPDVFDAKTLCAARILELGRFLNKFEPGVKSTNAAGAAQGIRYRFYVSSAILRGRKAAAGSIGRVPAVEIESAVRAALETHQRNVGHHNSRASSEDIERVTIGGDRLLITIAGTSDEPGQEFTINWSPKAKDVSSVEGNGAPDVARNESLIQSIVRAHAWMHRLREGAYDSIERLADANGIHPKVVRQNLRLAFLSPRATSAILEGSQPAGLSLTGIPKLLPLSWTDQSELLG
jgi:hypothetical protein